MALDANQKGYDVVSWDGMRISVKTITSRQNITFNAGTLNQVQPVIVLLLTNDPDKGVFIEEIFDEEIAAFRQRLTPENKGKQYLYVPKCRVPAGYAVI